MKEDYKYDVAFSFLQDDEQLALQIADRIRDRVNVFVYSERQKVFAGSDGVDQHMRIYAEESRVVVVLHRESWGQTEWTRVEEMAIKNRGFEEGYDFLEFVTLDKSERPKWLPKTRIRVVFERYGIDGVASTIEAAVQSEGGTVRSESIADYAARIDREISFSRNRSAFLSSERGVASAKLEVENLFSELRRLVNEVNASASKIQLMFYCPTSAYCEVAAPNAGFGVTWHLRWGNTLDDAGLTFIYREGGAFMGGYQIKQPQKEKRVAYEVDVDLSENIIWREQTGEKKLLTSTQLAELWIKRLLDHARGRLN